MADQTISSVNKTTAQNAEVAESIDEVRNLASPGGWYFVKDGLYTATNRRVIPANTRTKLTNDGTSPQTNIAFRPDGSLFWDTTTNKFVADSLGDRYQVRINISIIPSANSRSAVIDFDIGTANLPVVERVFLSEGAGVVHKKSFTTIFGAGQGLINNGGTFNITSTVQIEIFDLSFDIVKDQKG